MSVGWMPAQWESGRRLTLRSLPTEMQARSRKGCRMESDSMHFTGGVAFERWMEEMVWKSE